MSAPEPTDIILLSGGVESGTLLMLRGDAPGAVVGLNVDYGQRAATRERAAATDLCARAGATFAALDLSQAAEAFQGPDRRYHVPLPHRNLVLLSLAISYAERRGARRVAIALGAEDAGAYPTADGRFIDHIQSLARVLGAIEIEAPLISLRKGEIIRRGLAAGVDYALTYSCLLGGPRHCGRCPQCRHRKAAFREAGAPEPPGFYLR